MEAGAHAKEAHEQVGMMPFNSAPAIALALIGSAFANPRITDTGGDVWMQKATGF